MGGGDIQESFWVLVMFFFFLLDTWLTMCTHFMEINQEKHLRFMFVSV